MNIVLVTSLIVVGTIVIGAIIAFLVFQLSNQVRKEQFALEVNRTRYNQSLTAGHQITVEAETQEQLEEAIRLDPLNREARELLVECEKRQRLAHAPTSPETRSD